MKKKVVSVLLCVAMTATMLLGCSAGSEKSDSKKSSKSESGGTTEMKVDGDATTINVWTFIELHQKFYTEMAKKWNEEHPDKKVKLVLSNMQYDDMHNKLSLALESGKGAPDVVDIELGKFPSFTNGKIGLMDLTDAIAPYKDNVVESRLDIYGKDGKYFQEGIERFKKEAKTLEKAAFCNHVVQIYDYFEENETGYIVMEYVPGITVWQQVEKQGVFQPGEMLALLEPLMRDLQKLHEKGFLHRDISPDNMILRPDGVVKLIDFGAARKAEVDAQGSQKSMTVVVRQQYAPREQFSRNGRQGPWTDIYSLSATMYYMLTGKVPVSALERESETASRKMQENLNRISPALAEVLEKGMAFQPEDRYSDFTVFLHALKEAVPMEKERTRIEKTVYFNREKKGRKVLPLWKKRRILIGVSAAVILVWGSVIAWQKMSGEKAAPVTETVRMTSPEPSAETEALITMPRVEGERLEEALQRIKQADDSLSVVVEKQYSETAKDRIVSQSIAPGEQYKKGNKTDVTIVVSKGIEKIKVPNVVGKSLSEAKAVLKASGLKISLKKVFSNDEKNSILKQKENGKVKKGSVIHLTVSKGTKTPAKTGNSTSQSRAAEKTGGIQIITD